MTLKTRRILLAICVILFMLFSPIVILYSFGFRYDLRDGKIIQTGIIYLIPQPQDNIKIFVNSKEEKERLSIKGILSKNYVIYNLLPQTYNIKIQKDGYWEWEKNLAVSPGIITYARPLLLPLNPANDPIFSDSNILNWSISPNFNKIAYIKNDGGKLALAVYDINRKNTESIELKDIGAKMSPAEDFSAISDFKAEILWASNSRNLALKILLKSSKIVLLNSNEQGIFYLSDLAPDGEIIQNAWSGEDGSFLYATDKAEMYLINLFSSINKPLKIADNVSEFSVKGDNIYYLDAKSLFVYEFPLSNPETKRQVSLKPLMDSIRPNPVTSGTSNSADSNAEIVVSIKSEIALITADKNLYLIKQNGIPVFLSNDINSAKFSKDGGLLLYNSPSGIFTYSLDSGAENLVTRLAQKIGNVAWYKDYEHVWFTGDNVLKNIELDSRPVPNIIDFQKIPLPYTEFIYDINGGKIYYDQLDGNNLTIYRLNSGD